MSQRQRLSNTRKLKAVKEKLAIGTQTNGNTPPEKKAKFSVENAPDSHDSGQEIRRPSLPRHSKPRFDMGETCNLLHFYGIPGSSLKKKTTPKKSPKKNEPLKTPKKKPVKTEHAHEIKNWLSKPKNSPETQNGAAKSKHLPTLKGGGKAQVLMKRKNLAQSNNTTSKTPNSSKPKNLPKTKNGSLNGSKFVQTKLRLNVKGVKVDPIVKKSSETSPTAKNKSKISNGSQNNHPIKSPSSKYSTKSPIKYDVGGRKRNAKLALKKILSQMNVEEEEREKVAKIKDDISKLLISPSSSNSESGAALIPDAPVIQDRISDTPPGLEIFDCDRYLCYLSNTDALTKANKPILDEFNAVNGRRMSWKMFLTNISNGQFLKVDTKQLGPEWFDFLFNLMIVTEMGITAQMCQEILEKMINEQCKLKQDKIWFPDMTLIYKALLNLGVIQTRNSPNQHQIRTCRVKISIGKSSPKKPAEYYVQKDIVHVCDNSGKHNAVVSCSKFMMITEVIVFCIMKSNGYKSEELCQLITSFTWLSLDSKILHNPVVEKIKQLCTLALDKIDSQHWPTKLESMSESMVKFGEQHHNVLYLMNNLPDTERGNSLKAVTSYRELMKNLGETNFTFREKIKAKSILRFLKQKPFAAIKNYYLLNSLISLLGFCIIKEEAIKEPAVIENIGQYLMTIYSKIPENLFTKEESKLKQRIALVKCNLVLTSKEMSLYNMDGERVEV